MEPLERICGICDLFADCSMKDTVTGCAGWRRIASSGTQRSEVPCKAPGSATELDDLEWLDKHWLTFYKDERVGNVFASEMVKLGGFTAREIIQKMRSWEL